MRFLIIGLNYLPESTSIGPYTAGLAQYLHEAGHQVQVITGFPIAPQWRVWDGYRGRLFMRETIDGVDILRTFLYVPSQPKKAIQRILFDLSFSISAWLGGMFSGSADLVVVISPPLQLGFTGWLISKLKRIPFFIHIQDLVPDAAVVTGMLKEDSLPVQFAHKLEKFIYRRAKGIGVISEGFALNLQKKGVSPLKINLLPNYIDLTFMNSTEHKNDFQQRQGLSVDQFLVMYSGSIALKQGLHTFVETAAKFSAEDKVSFYLVGEGPYLEELRLEAEKLKVSTLTFLALQPRGTLSEQLRAADILVITQRKAVTDVVFPGKLLYYMAAGRPILAAVSSDSETGRFILQNEVGVVVPPEDPDALAQAVRFLQVNPAEALRLGTNGRRVVEAKFDGKVVLKQFAKYLENLAL